jgi:hypothetical protein
MAERESKPVSAGANETSGRCCKTCQSFVKKLPEAPHEATRHALNHFGWFVHRSSHAIFPLGGVAMT